MVVINVTQSNSDWLFSTQSRELQADWLIFDNNEYTTGALLHCTDMSPSVKNNSNNESLTLL